MQYKAMHGILFLSAGSSCAGSLFDFTEFSSLNIIKTSINGNMGRDQGMGAEDTYIFNQTFHRIREGVKPHGMSLIGSSFFLCVFSSHARSVRQVPDCFQKDGRETVRKYAPCRSQYGESQTIHGCPEACKICSESGQHLLWRGLLHF